VYTEVMRTSYLAFGRPNFSDEEEQALVRVLRSGWVGMGPETLAFERELADFVGAPHVVTVNSCTSALFLSLLAAGVRQGDEVICPSLTWCSTANAALYLGARPVFCDVDEETLCVSPESVAARLSSRTRAVIAVHFAGYGVDVAALRRALPREIAIVEDAAHALGARYPDGSPVGSSRNPVCFSFYANKNLSTAEGGAIAFFDQDAAERAASLRQHALPIDAWKRFTQPKSLLLSGALEDLGYKMNYTDLQAALGRVQLRRQGEFAATRGEVARVYFEALKDLKPVRFQRDCTGERHARHLFVIRARPGWPGMARDELVAALRAKNLGASVHYAPLHRMPLYARAAPHPALPVTEEAAASILTLPIGATMSREDALEVVRELRTLIA
jgi:UDP-4-amino-4-deoxy-L-arabinose-oxoglutarate aminotransferase